MGSSVGLMGDDGSNSQLAWQQTPNAEGKFNKDVTRNFEHLQSPR